MKPLKEPCFACSRENRVKQDAVARLFSVGAMSGYDIGLGIYLTLDWQRRYGWCSRGW